MEFTSKSTSKRAMSEMNRLTERLQVLADLEDVLHSTEQSILTQPSDVVTDTLLKLIDKYGQLIKRYTNIFKTVVEQAKSAQQVVHGILLQLKSSTNLKDVRISKHTKIVQTIYDSISEIINELESVDQLKLFNDQLTSFQQRLQIPLKTIVTQGHQIKQQAKEQLKQAKEQLVETIQPIKREQIKQQIEQQTKIIKTVTGALNICQKMKKLPIDSQSSVCRPARRSSDQPLIPCPTDSRWCNYCLSDQSKCFAPKLSKIKGQYRMKPRVIGAHTEMFADGVCQPLYSRIHQPCPIQSKHKHYCVRDLSQCDGQLRIGKRDSFSRKVPVTVDDI